ncbi:LuxR C-terminal-related transcriptional regulator [Streptomyces sp. NBC_00582]|uniref:LuxR C-terminal-related transcriptional regulator n=1 Tax=Streptomyces sp. NBC_00582 TaxID=2975783 RepID=UPI002E7FC024|nr:AAA family ATPase [Streptomyces sp. NBC_00582]WUB66995.1 LuxR C-terminal-related transcriptional regulator [Streptomyces sp. NBC_00582]
MELTALRDTVDRAPGTPPNLVLHGDPGVGKTVLLQACVGYARERGMRVLGGSGYESEAQLAFAGLHQLFAPVMKYLDRVDPFHRDVLRRVLGLRDGPPPDRLAISVATVAVLAAVAEDGPVLIAVEDAHWVDIPTREVMMFLLLRLEPYDIRAVFARRPLTATERVTPGIRMLEVEPLDEPAAEELLDLLHPELPEPVRRRVLREAAGNPLALAELPGDLGTDAATQQEMLPDGAPLRTRLESGYAGRVLSLPTELRTVLLLTALDGDRVEHRASPARPTALSPLDVREVERIGLVTRDSTPSGVRFRHPLVRSAIIKTASPDELRAAHATLAEQYRTDPERRVWHLAAAAVEPSEEVAAEIEQAARSVGMRGGTGLAVTAWRRAAALSPAPSEAARRLQQAAELASEAGQLGLAQKLLDEAREHLGDPGRSGHGLTTRARILLLRDGDLVAARRLLARAVALDAAPGAGVALERTVLARIVAASYAQDPAEWAELREVLADRGDRLSHQVHLLHDVLGDLPRTGHDMAPRLREAFDSLPVDVMPGRVAELCRAAAWLDLLHDYRPHFRDLIRQESGGGAVTHAAGGHWFAAHDHFLSGEWEAAEAAASAGLDLCIRHDLQLLAHDLRCSLGWLAAGRGDVDSVREYSRTIEQWAAPRGSTLHLTMSARNLALAALSEGDNETAYAQCVRVGPPGTLAPHTAYAPWLVLDLVDAALRTGRTQEARAHIAAADRAGLADLTPRLRLQILTARALAASDEEAVPLLKAALALPRVEQWPFDHARVRLVLGELHRRRHRPGDARPELRRAAEIFGRMGATAWRRRAEQELRAAGVAVTPEVVPGRSADPGSGALTAQQLEVARLAASGLSNKEIGERLYLSPRTVSAHLYRVFPKLGITSRSALRDALGALDDSA